MGQPERLGILGGSFDPVHLGHLIMAQCALEQARLARIVFVPCRRQPLKPCADAMAPQHRLAMLHAALDGDARFAVSDLELRRAGPSYSIDTVRAFRQRHPEARLFFIMGADALLDLHRWHEAGVLLELCTIVTVTRPGIEPDALTPERLQLASAITQRLQADMVHCCGIGISSTAIRQRVAQSLSIRYLVPPRVDDYIREHQLYRTPDTVSPEPQQKEPRSKR